MATNRSCMHLTLVPVITMKVHTHPSTLGSANQVVVGATPSASQCSRCDNDEDDIHHLCNISNAHHKYDEDVDMEFNKLIECIEAKISDDDDDDDEDRDVEDDGIFDGQSDCLVYPKMEREEKDVMDCKVGDRFSPSVEQSVKTIEKYTWKGDDSKKNITYTTEPMLYHQENTQWEKKSFHDRKADSNNEAELIQKETPGFSQGHLFCLSSTDNQVKCPVLKSSLVINNGLYKDDITTANPESECDFNICGNLAAPTPSSVTVNSVSTCSFPIKAITTHETSAAASSTAITKVTSQYKNPADEKSPIASDVSSIYLSPLHSSSHECRHHLAPASSWASSSSIDITRKNNTTGNTHNAYISDNRINDIITIQPDTLNPKNQFKKPVQQHELQIIVPTATNCNISNKVDNNYHDFSDIEEVIGSSLHCPEKPVSYSSSISLFMSPSSLHVADKGTSGPAFTPFYCTLTPVLDTVTPTNQPSTSQIPNNTRNAKNLSCPIQRKQAQVHFHGHMSHTLVPKVGQSQLPHALAINKTSETFSRVDVKTATTTATTTTAIVFTESKKAQTDTATSTTTTATTASVELCSKGYSLQGDCDNCRGGGEDDGCSGPIINYTPNSYCYFCNTSVTDLDKSTRLHENNNYYNFDDKEHIKEFQIPQEYQTQEEEEKDTMQKSSVDFYVENAWSSTDAILKGRKSRVSITQTSGWKEKMTSTEKMDNEGIKNKGNLSHFTLGNWEKLPTEADNNNNEECLWTEGEKEDDSCPTLKEFELDNGRTIMTVISIKSNKKDEKESPITSPTCYSQQTSQETALISEKQSKIIFNIDESKLHKRKQDTKPRFEISPEKPQLMKIEREVKTLTNNGLGSKLVKDDWIKKMTNSNLTKKTEPKETNCVRQMTQAIESKLLRNNSFSNAVTDKVSQKTSTQSDAPQRCKPRRNKTFPQTQIRPQLFKFRSEHSEQTQFTSHFDTIPARTNFNYTNEQLSNVFSERNENESKDWKKQFPMKEFIIKTKEMGRASDQNLDIIEVGERFPALDGSMLKSSPISWSWKTSDVELSQTVCNDGHITSSEKFPKYLTEKCSYHPLSRIETGSSTQKDTDEPDASVVKKTTEFRVQLCPPKTSVRLKSPPSVNAVAPLHILPLSNAGEIYSKKECHGNETSSEISDEENRRIHSVSKVDDNTSYLVADTILGYSSKHISDSRITRLAVKEVSINPSKDDLNIAINSPRKPVFLSPLKDEECIAGKPLTLRCEVIGWPEPKVFWKFDGLNLDGQEHYVSEYNGRVAILQLPDLLPSDEGTYSCVAQNKAGQAETNANLTVLGFAPDIYDPLESVKAQLGCPVCIQCRTKGNPPPTTSWKFNGQPLDSNRHVRFSNSGDLYMMEISHLKSEDVGCYEFQAVNPFGSSMCTGHILLEDPKVQKRKEPAAKFVIQPKESKILKPLSPKMSFSQRPESFASINHSPDEKSQVQEPESETFSSAGKNKSQALNYKDSSENMLAQSKGQFGSKDVSRNRAAISGITRMMNRAARELDSVFQEDSSEEELVSILKSSISPKSSSYLITTSPSQISHSSISTTAFTTKQILTTRSDFIQTTATMTSYDQIDDEDQLHEMMSKVENFEERKKIRARIREIREKKLNELEERRIENEKIANDALKEKVRRADEEKERKMQAYKEQSNITAVMEDRRLQTSQDCLKERQSKADEDKRKKLEFYDQIAKKENEAKMLATGDDAKTEAKPAASASTPDSKSTSQKKSGDANKENIETKEAEHEIQQKIEQPSKDTKDDEIENLAKADPASDKAEDKKMDEPEQIKEDLKEKSKEKDDENEITKKEEETVVKPEVAEKNEGTTEKLSEEGKDKEKHEAKNDDSTENVKDEKAAMEQNEEKKDDSLEKSKQGGESCEKTEDKKDGAVEKAKEDDGKPKETTETTTVTSKDGKTTTVTTVQTITDKNETRIITTEVATKTMPDGGTSTKTSKRTKIIQNQMGFGGGMAAPGGLAPAGRGRGLTRSPSAIKQMLLQWAKAMTQEYSDKITITNFSSSWNNGIAFCALIHHFFPDAFDFDALDPKKRRHNFDLAFKTAEKMADIAPLLDTEDMMRMKNPDWKCVFTYVQSMYQKLQSHANNKAMPLPEKPAS